MIVKVFTLDPILNALAECQFRENIQWKLGVYPGH